MKISANPSKLKILSLTLIYFQNFHASSEKNLMDSKISQKKNCLNLLNLNIFKIIQVVNIYYDID